MADVPSWLLDVVLVVLLVGAFASAAALAIVEVSLLRVRVSRVRVEAAQGDRRSIDLLRLLDDLPLVLNTVLFVVLGCQVAVAAISGFLAQRWAGGTSVTVVSIMMSLLLFVYAEALPKTMAVRAPHERALRASRHLRTLVRIWRPLVSFLVKIANVHMPKKHGATVDVISERELRLLAHQAAQAGVIAREDADLVDRSFAFGDQVVRDVMVDRAQIVAVAASESVSAALGVAIAAGHRRVPVFGRDVDDIVGLVRLRDLAAVQEKSGVGEANVMTAPLFCRADDLISDLIDRMRRSGTWLAIARNNEGQTVGLLTVEDIVAELLGEIEEGPGVTQSRVEPVQDHDRHG